MATSPYSSSFGSGSSPYSKNRKKKDKNAELLALAKELGLDKDPEVAKPKDNFLTKLGKIVDAPRQALTNAYSYATGSKRTKDDKSIFDAMGKGFTGTREVNIADILEDSGMGDETLFKMPVTGKDISARDIAGFAGDVVLDPLNLVGIGVAGKAAKLAKVAGEGGQATVHLNKAGRALQKSHIEDAIKKVGAKGDDIKKVEEDARQEFAKMMRNNPEKLKGMEDLGGLKFAGQTLVKGKNIAKGAKALEAIPVAGKVVKGAREGADELGDLFHKGFKAKRAGFEEVVDVAAQSKSAKNAAFDRAQILQKDLEKKIKKVKPKDLSDAEADLRIGNAIEDPTKKEAWMEGFIDEVKGIHDELYKVDDILAKDKGITEEWYRDNYLTRIFKDEPAKVDAVLSKYLTANGLKNDPSFLKKRGFQGTTDDIVKFAEEQGVKLTPASTAERVAARQRMSDIAHGRREALEGIKKYGVFDESLAKEVNQSREMTKGAIDRDIKNPKFIANAEEQRKQVGVLWKNKREQLEKAIAANKSPEDIAKIKGEFDKVNQEYAKLAQAAERNRVNALPKSVDDIPKPSDNISDYLQPTPVRDYTGAATGRPTPALAALAEKATEFTDADDFIQAIAKNEVDMDMLRAAQKEMADEGLIVRGDPKQTLYDFFAGATGQPKKFNKASLEKRIDEYLFGKDNKAQFRSSVLEAADLTDSDLNRLKTIVRKNQGMDADGLDKRLRAMATKSGDAGARGFDEIADQLIQAGLVKNDSEAFDTLMSLPTKSDVNAARIPEMNKLDEINRVEREAEKQMNRAQRQYQSEVNKLAKRQQQQIEDVGSGVDEVDAEIANHFWPKSKSIIDDIRKTSPNEMYENMYFKGKDIDLDRGYARYLDDNMDKLPEDLQREWMGRNARDWETGESIPGYDSIRGTHVFDAAAEYNELVSRQIDDFSRMADEGIEGAEEASKVNKQILKETNPKMEGYVSVPDIPELKGYKFPPTVADFIHKEFTKTGKLPNDFLKSLDIAMGAWKVGVTSLPTSMVAFHSRNLIGNKFNKWLGGFYNAPLRAGKIEKKVATEFGKNVKDINKVKFVDDFGVEWTAEKLRKAGIMGGQAENELNAANKALNMVSKPGRKIGQFVEDPDRVSFFLQQRAMGKSVEEAAAHVNKYLFNYGNQTDLVQKVGKVVPFFTWTANNLPLQVEQLLKQPHKFNKVANLYQSSFSPEEQENLPGYVKEGIFLEGEQKTNDEGDIIQTVIRNLGLPVEELARLNRGSFGRTFEREILGSLGPGIKQAAELATGRDFFRGEDIEDINSQYAFGVSNYPDEIKALLGYKETDGGQMADGTTFKNRSVDAEMIKLIDALGLSRAMNTLFPSSGDSSNPLENLDEVGTKAALPFANSEYNMTDEKKKREREMLERITKLLVEEGKLREYTNYYQPKDDKKKTTANR